MLDICFRNSLQSSLLFTIFIEVTKGGDLVGRCLEIPRAVGSGKSLQELRRNMADVISLVQKFISEEVPTTLSNNFIERSATASQCLQ